MRGQLRDRVNAVVARARRVERRELREFRRWVEQTSSLVHLSVLVFVPLLIGLVTALSNALAPLSFLLFPPLASGTYTLFANPEGRYASPPKFVSGLTVGALCGWGAVVVAGQVGLSNGSGTLSVGAAEAALAVFAAGAVTWALSIEEPAAYSTALLALLVPSGREIAFTVSVFFASSIVAIVFSVWRVRFYERRAQFLYESTKGDDHVLVPMRGDNPDATAMLAARLAAAHDAGKVILLDIVDDADVARAERDLLEDRRPSDRSTATDGGRSLENDGSTDGVITTDGGQPPDDGEQSAATTSAVDTENPPEDGVSLAVSESAEHLEERAADIETTVGVPCEVVVAVDGRSPAATVLKTAHEVSCDLIAAAYEERHGGLSPYLRGLFSGDADVIVHRSREDRTLWRRILVPVRGASDVAHSMLDFAGRLAGRRGYVTACTCVTGKRERRRAEEMLADLVEAFDDEFETRVSTRTIERFLSENADDFDLVIMGASQDRSAASRLISPPTFERIQDVDADIAIVDRN